MFLSKETKIRCSDSGIGAFNLLEHPPARPVLDCEYGTYRQGPNSVFFLSWAAKARESYKVGI